MALLTNTLKYLNNSQRAKHLHYKLGLHYLSVNNFDEVTINYNFILFFIAYTIGTKAYYASADVCNARKNLR